MSGMEARDLPYNGRPLAKLRQINDVDQLGDCQGFGDVVWYPRTVSSGSLYLPNEDGDDWIEFTLTTASGGTAQPFSGAQLTADPGTYGTGAPFQDIPLVEDVTGYDTDDYHDNITNPERLTSPELAYYELSFTFQMTTSDGTGGPPNLQLFIWDESDLSDREVVIPSSNSEITGAATYFYTFTITLPLDVGDYLKIQLQNLMSSDLSLANFNITFLRIGI